MKKLESLSVFFPAYNDALNLPKLIERTYSILPSITKTFEVLIINDGSYDQTQQVATHLSKLYKNLRVITHKKNRGYGGALKSGFKYSQYDWIFYTDGDGQYDTREIVKLIKKVTHTIDVINGYKLSRGDGIRRRIIGEINNKLMHAFFNVPISDIDCDFRLIRKKYINQITLKTTSGTICIELIMKLKWAGAQFAEVGVHHYNRSHGNSQFFNVRNIIKTLKSNWDFYQKSKYYETHTKTSYRISKTHS